MQELAILTNGNLQVQSLNTGSAGLVSYDATGTLKPLNFSGNSGDVLTGNGTWVVGRSFSQWITNGNNIYYNTGYVGIGIQNPTSPLTVAGNIVSTGNMYAQNLAVAQGLSVGTVMVTSTGNVDTLRSTAGLQVNATTVNASTINTQKFNADSLKALALTTHRILPYPGDSVIYLGDNAFGMSTSGLYEGSIHFVPTQNQGIGLNVFQTIQPGWSCAMGRQNVITGTQSITIGNFLTNSNTNCIMMGINNPVLFIDQNNNVGIGTTTPHEKMDVTGADANGVVAIFHNGIPNGAYGANNVFITAGVPDQGNWSYLTQKGDNGIFWSDQPGFNNTSGFVIAPHSQSFGGIRIGGNGNVGIANAAPTAALDVNGTINASGAPNKLWTTSVSSPYTPATSNNNAGWLVPITIPSGGAIRTSTTGGTNYSDNTTGRYLGFGMVDNDGGPGNTTGWYWIIQNAKDQSNPACYPMTLIMDVNGNATLTVSQNGWADKVFDKHYTKMTISEKEQYYNKYKHLPNIDATEIVEKKGLNINKNMKGMLQNIEENRLDITELNNIIGQQQIEIDELKKQIKELEHKSN